MTIKGFVERVLEYPSKYTDKFGKPKPSMWAMYVDNQRFGCGPTKPPAAGTYVSFEATETEKGWNVDGATLKQETPPSGQSPKVSTPAAAAASHSVVADNRQDSIIYQSSRKDALEWTGYLLQHGLIDFGKAKGAQKIAIAEIFLDTYTKRFFDDCKRLSPPESSGPQRAVAPDGVQELAKPAAKAAVAPPAEAEEPAFGDELPF